MRDPNLQDVNNKDNDKQRYVEEEETAAIINDTQSMHMPSSRLPQCVQEQFFSRSSA